MNRFRKNEIISRDRTCPRKTKDWRPKSFNLIVKLVFLAEKRGVMEGNGGEGAAAEGPRRSPRGGGAIVSYVTPKYSPGDAALKAAYEYTLKDDLSHPD